MPNYLKKSFLRKSFIKKGFQRGGTPPQGASKGKVPFL